MKLLLVNQFSNDHKHLGHKRHIYILDELKKLGIDVKLVTSNRSYIDGKKLKFESNDIEPINVFFKNKGYISRALSYVEFSVKVFFFTSFRNYDVVIASSPNLLTTYISYIKCKIFNLRFFFEVRDLWPLSFSNLGILSKQNLIYKLLKVFEKRVLLGAEGVIHTMPYFIKYLEDYSFSIQNTLYLPQIIHNLEKEPKKKKRGFVYIGTAKQNTSIINLIDVFNEFNKEQNYSQTLDFFITGEGVESIKAYVAKNLIRNIRFNLPINTKQDLIYKLAEFKFGLTNFQNYEIYKYGQSFNKISDYFSARIIPIIPNEIVNDARIKDLIISSSPANDALLKCMKIANKLTDDVYDEMQKNIISRSKAYTANNLVKELISFINNK